MKPFETVQKWRLELARQIEAAIEAGIFTSENSISQAVTALRTAPSDPTPPATDGSVRYPDI